MKQNRSFSCSNNITVFFSIEYFFQPFFRSFWPDFTEMLQTHKTQINVRLLVVNFSFVTTCCPVVACGQRWTLPSLLRPLKALDESGRTLKSHTGPFKVVLAASDKWLSLGRRNSCTGSGSDFWSQEEEWAGRWAGDQISLMSSRGSSLWGTQWWKSTNLVLELDEISWQMIQNVSYFKWVQPLVIIHVFLTVMFRVIVNQYSLRAVTVSWTRRHGTWRWMSTSSTLTLTRDVTRRTENVHDSLASTRCSPLVAPQWLLPTTQVLRDLATCHSVLSAVGGACSYICGKVNVFEDFLLLLSQCSSKEEFVSSLVQFLTTTVFSSNHSNRVWNLSNFTLATRSGKKTTC